VRLGRRSRRSEGPASPSLPRRTGLRLGLARRDPAAGHDRARPTLGTRQEAETNDAARRARRVRVARLVGVGGTVAALGAVLAIGVFPTRTWLDQRAGIAEAELRIGVLRDQNAAFEERISRLDSDEEIERLAREQYNLVLPGEEAYAVLPPPLPPVDLPALWPFGPLTDGD
jgi:cell division protein FtsB